MRKPLTAAALAAGCIAPFRPALNLILRDHHVVPSGAGGTVV